MSVLDVALAEDHIQRYRLTAFADAADHASAHDKPGPTERGLQGLQQCVARIRRHPWPESALTADEAGRLGVGEFGGVTQGDAGTGRLQFKFPDGELQRLLFWDL